MRAEMDMKIEMIIMKVTMMLVINKKYSLNNDRNESLIIMSKNKDSYR